MPVFQVSINGKQVSSAGVGEFGVVTAIVNWVRRKAERTASGKADPKSGRLRLEVGGLDSSGTRAEHLAWQNRGLKVGDEVRIRIVRSAPTDRPRSRRFTDKVVDIRAQKKYVRQMAKKLGWKVTTR